MPDDAARLTHLLDQAGGHLDAIAPRLRAYFHALTSGEDAIPPEQAIELVRDVQRRMIGWPKGLDDAGP
jgi:hypothetical protein